MSGLRFRGRCVFQMSAMRNSRDRVRRSGKSGHIEGRVAMIVTRSLVRYGIQLKGSTKLTMMNELGDACKSFKLFVPCGQSLLVLVVVTLWWGTRAFRHLALRRYASGFSRLGTARLEMLPLDFSTSPLSSLFFKICSGGWQ